MVLYLPMLFCLYRSKFYAGVNVSVAIASTEVEQINFYTKF